MKKDTQNQPKNKEVAEKLELVCASNRNCCGWGKDCPGEHVVFPSGKLGFQRCGC
ncbi:hypothetical protein ACFVV6_29675 [Bacillus mycoides]|uniref:hypothetical protein n=1 Tax=Bacillus mycoides TaxID=1405 RepID=UPI00365ED7A0